MKYILKSDKNQIVMGIGALKKDVELTVDETQALWFWKLNGVPLSQPNVPDGVTVTVDLEGE